MGIKLRQEQLEVKWRKIELGVMSFSEFAEEKLKNGVSGNVIGNLPKIHPFNTNKLIYMDVVFLTLLIEYK